MGVRSYAGERCRRQPPNTESPTANVCCHPRLERLMRVRAAVCRAWRSARNQKLGRLRCRDSEPQNSWRHLARLGGAALFQVSRSIGTMYTMTESTLESRVSSKIRGELKVHNFSFVVFP